MRADPWRTRWDLRIDAARGNHTSCSGVLQSPNRSESPTTCGRSTADVPHLRADAPVHKLYQDSIHVQATQGRRRSHTSTRLDVSKQDGCTIYMQEGIRLLQPCKRTITSTSRSIDSLLRSSPDPPTPPVPTPTSLVVLSCQTNRAIK